jgi:transcription elongation factor Elf1
MSSYYTTPILIAQYLGGVIFECPRCGTENIHSPSDPTKSIMEEFGTTRVCGKCGCNYYLKYANKRF